MRELASRMGVHYTTVAKLENSQRKLTEEWREKFAKAFQVNPWDVSGADTYGVPAIKDYALPILKISDGKKWKDVRLIAKDYLQSAEHLASDWAFYIYIDHETQDNMFPLGSFVIVDPEKGELVDTHRYAILVNGEVVRLVEYRSEPPRFEPCSISGEGESVAIGQTPFVTIGMIYGAYRRMPYVDAGLTI